MTVCGLQPLAVSLPKYGLHLVSSAAGFHQLLVKVMSLQIARQYGFLESGEN